MTASELVTKIRNEGGRIWLDRQGRVRAKNVSGEDLLELRRSRDLVAAILRDEVSSVRWEHTGKNPNWWRVPERAWTYPDQTLKPLSELVRMWLAEHCVRSMRCFTKAWALHREFLAWLGLGPSVATERDFLEQMAGLGWPSVDGWIANIALAEDFAVALFTSDQRPSCSEAEDKEALSKKALADVENLEEPEQERSA